MSSFRRILVATDFSEPANHAIDIAIALASAFGAELVVFHAYWFPPIGYAAFAEGLCWPTTDMLAQDTKVFDATVDRVKLRYRRTEGTLVSGEPSASILEAVKSRDVDVIVLGTHGERGLARVLLGNVAEKVVRLSPVPVLAIPGNADAVAKESTASPAQTR
jgi:nucleotide-binding universal stress UspA family protein